MAWVLFVVVVVFAVGGDVALGGKMFMDAEMSHPGYAPFVSIPLRCAEQTGDVTWAPSGAGFPLLELSERVHDALTRHHAALARRTAVATDVAAGARFMSNLGDRQSRLQHELAGTVWAVEEVGSVAEVDSVANTAIKLTNLQNTQYVGEITIGTVSPNKAPQTLAVVLDTGSTNAWVNSVRCQDPTCLRTRQFDERESSSFVRVGDPKKETVIDFGTGEIQGGHGKDVISFGPFKVADQVFGLIGREEGSVFNAFVFEGILGLAFPSMSSGGVTPFFDNVIQQRVLCPPGGSKCRNEFAFYFTPFPDKSSSVQFGGVNPTHYKGPLRYCPVVEEHYWMVDIEEVTLGGEVIQGPSKAIFDTGTSFNAAPTSLAAELAGRLAARPCNELANAEDLPDMVFKIRCRGGPVFMTLTKEQYMVASAGKCNPALMGVPVPEPHGPAWILGEVTMRHFYVVYDRRDPGDTAAGAGARIGIAASAYSTN